MYPVLFHIGPFPIYAFGLMVTLGFAAGLALSYRLAKRDGLEAEALVDATVWILLASIVGARLLFVLLNWGDFRAEPLEMLRTWRGGMSFHGGLVGGVLAGWLYTRRRGLPFWTYADVAAPGLALGYTVGRIGCLLNGCCYGGPTHLAWAITPHQPGEVALAVPSHPVPLYAALLNLAFCPLLIALYRRKVFPGQVMVTYLVLYSVYRFAVEFLRKGVTADVLALGLTEAQVASLVVIAIGLGYLASRLRAARRTATLHAGAPTTR